ncbi:MAG: hypothetical protein Q9198_007876 [Flavoplaca austrocitrina]
METIDSLSDSALIEAIDIGFSFSEITNNLLDSASIEAFDGLSDSASIDGLSDSASIEAVNGLSDSDSTEAIDNLSDSASTATSVNPTHLTYDDLGRASVPRAANTISSAVELQEAAMQIPRHRPAPASSTRPPLSSLDTMIDSLLLICHLIILTTLIMPTITFLILTSLAITLVGKVEFTHSEERQLFIDCLKMVLLVYFYASAFSHFPASIGVMRNMAFGAVGGGWRVGRAGVGE